MHRLIPILWFWTSCGLFRLAAGQALNPNEWSLIVCISCVGLGATCLVKAWGRE